MSPLHAIILGIIQGLTEFLPVSSSAHLLLVPKLLGWPEQPLTFDVALHMGTLVALLAVFGADLYRLAVAAITRPTSPTGRFGWQIALATLPAAVVGFLLEDWIEHVLREQTLPIAIALVVLGVLLWWADRSGRKDRPMAGMGWWHVFLVGCAQALAVFPGVSRSGITITSGLMLGLERDEAARLSFYLSFPIILGAGLVEMPKLGAADINLSFFLGVLAAAVSGYIVIRALLGYLKRGSYLAFAGWRILLAALVWVVLR